MFYKLRFFFLTFLQLYWSILVFKSYIILLKIHGKFTEVHFLKMFFTLFTFAVFLRTPLQDYKMSSINWKQLLLDKKNRYDQRTDFLPVCQYLYGNTYLQQWHLFITPNLTHYGDLDIVLEARALHTHTTKAKLHMFQQIGKRKKSKCAKNLDNWKRTDFGRGLSIGQLTLMKCI